MRDLRTPTTHTVHVSVLDRNGFLNMGAEESQNLARVVSHVGQHSPLHASAGGKAYLSALPTPRVLEIIAETGLPKVASRTITDLDALLADLELTRKQGYGVARDERTEGVHSFGMLIGNPNSARPYTIAISMPTGSLDCDAEAEPLVAHLRGAANRLRHVIEQYQR